MAVEDLLGLPDSAKFAEYDAIEARRQMGHRVRTREDESGFPAVVIIIDGKDAVLTDCLSMEEWNRQRHGLKHFIVHADNLRVNRGVDAKDPADAIARVTKDVRHKLVHPHVETMETPHPILAETGPGENLAHVHARMCEAYDRWNHAANRIAALSALAEIRNIMPELNDALWRLAKEA